MSGEHGVALTRTGRSRPWAGDGVRWASVALAGLVCVPLLVLFSAWLTPADAVWRHLANTVLAGLIGNTLLLAAGVAVGVLVLGVGMAWLTALCEFPGRRFFDWALMLPLAVPAYVLAFVFLGLFDFSGPVQTWIRGWAGNGGYRFPEVRSTGGVVLVMTLVLYPYVYMLTRAAFLTQGRGTVEAARILGLGPGAAFFRITLPMARPAIVAGLALALMETLADFGTVAVFNFDTFTTAIYKAWFGLFNLQAAAQLASFLLLFVALALVGERRLRGRAGYHETGRGPRLERVPLGGWRAWAAAAAAGLIFGLAFVVPMVQLLVWVWDSLSGFDRRFLGLLWHTLLLGSSAAFVTVSCALILAHARRSGRGRAIRGAVSVATLGYALPGSVLAVGIMLALTGVDNGISTIWTLLTGDTPGPLLTGSIAGLLAAYLIRFMAVAYGPVGSALERVRPSLSEAARSLGATTVDLVRRVYLPLLRPGLLTAALLVMVDVMKEMPATLLLRPFGWDTLAVRIYELTSEGEWERASLPAVSLVLAGMLPVVLLVRRSAADQARSLRAES